MKSEKTKKTKSRKVSFQTEEFSDSDESEKSDELSSPPIMDSKEVRKFISDEPELVSSDYAYSLRITYSGMDLNIMFKSFKEFYGDIKFLMSIEKKGTESQHFHFSYLVDRPIKEERKHLIKFFNQYQIPRVRNKTYALTYIEKESFWSYVLKDGDYAFNIFTKEFVERMFVKSYKKFTKNDFADALHKLEADYLGYNENVYHLVTPFNINEPYRDIAWFFESFIRLKVSYKQIICYAYISKYGRMLYFKKFDDKIKDVARALAMDIIQGPYVRT